MSEPAEVEVFPPDPEQQSDEDLLTRIDGLADFLANFAKSESATPAIKVKIFGELVAWSKVKRALQPGVLEGNRLKEFHDELETRKGKGSTGTTSRTGPGRRQRDGAEIRKLIRSLPPVGRNGDAGADQDGSEREGVGGDSDGAGGVSDVDRDGESNRNGARGGGVL